VIGMAVDDKEKQQLEMIAEAGGGRYFAAGSAEELKKALVLAAKAISLWDQVNRCILDNLSGYGECVNVQYLKSLDYMDKMIMYIGEQRGSAAGGGFLEKEYNQVYKLIWKKFNELRAENWEQYDKDLRKLYPR